MFTNRKSTYYLNLFLDLLLLNVCFVVAAVVSQNLDILLDRNYMFILLAVSNFVWYFTSNVSSFYEDFFIHSYSYQLINIFKNIAAQIVLAVFFIFLVKEDLFTRNFILLYGFLLWLTVSVRIQVIKKITVKYKSKKQHLKNVIIIGAGEIGKNFLKLITDRKDLGFNFLGFADDNSNDDKIICKINEIEDAINKYAVDVAIITLSLDSSNEIEQIIKVCNKHALRVHIIPDYFRFVSKKYQINMIADFPIITVRNEPLSEAHWQFVKRTIDIILSSLVIILIFPWLLSVLFILNLFYSRGPLFFIQDRVRDAENSFRCFKFRTMRLKNNFSDKFIPTFKDDPRITKVGKWLRKTNLDELPQVINVFKGEMSIVGPRPHPKAYNELYKLFVDEINIRGWVKPGITGWAQVHGYRGDVKNEEENKKRIKKRIEYDLWYIENWTLWLDIQIMLLTFWQMIRGKNTGI
ncbi:MAG TPA: exopolysaccharide biosynthesis polyprenyl glycosylphosphotransferase [Ignavibacteria bacterium]|nr:exopolysaccharide biosynthesis polyprenyl glycosylphosphotransferase [Ignavibacteria bacterium]